MAENKEKYKNGRSAPSFSVQDEIKRDKSIRRTRNVRKARHTSRALITIMLCAMLFVIAVLSIVFTMTRVEEVIVSGNTRYSEEELLSAAETDGSVLPLIRRAVIQSRIINVCPYVSEVKLVKHYPSTLEIVVKEAEAVYAASVRGRVYSLDKDLRVMDFVDNTDGLVFLKLPEVKTVLEGKQIEFDDAKSSELITKLLNGYFGENNILGLTSLDLTNRFEIYGIIGENVKIHFGDYNNIEIKIKLADKLLTEAKLIGSTRTLIDVSSPSNGSIFPDYDGDF